MDNKLFNITRRQGRNVTIFRRNLTEADARREVRHLKRLARNSGGHVYFEMVAVPESLTPTGQTMLKGERGQQEARRLCSAIDQERNELLAEVA